MSETEEKTEDVPQLPAGCGYMGHEFGAPYLDSACFGGRLYDMDDGDGDLINEPDEYLPCPNCNMESWFEDRVEDVGGSIHGNEKSSLPMWKRICRFALKTNREEALRLLNGTFKNVTYLVEVDDDMEDRQWTFNEAELEESR